MAEAAANVLITDGYERKAYNIANVDTYSYQDIADTISEITGKSINYISPAIDEYTQILLRAGVPDKYIGFYTAFAVAQAQGEFDIPGN